MPTITIKLNDNQLDQLMLSLSNDMTDNSPGSRATISNIIKKIEEQL